MYQAIIKNWEFFKRSFPPITTNNSEGFVQNGAHRDDLQKTDEIR